MSPEGWAAITTVGLAVVAGMVTIFTQVKKTHELVNSRMTELLAITKSDAFRRGATSERDSPGATPENTESGK
jgi:hypothetical protein